MNRKARSLTGSIALAALFAACQPSTKTPTAAAGQGTPSNKSAKSAKPEPKRQTTKTLEGDLTYPRDKDLVLAKVNGRHITLEHIVDHVDARHYPGFRKLVSARFGQRELRIPRMADWVRQYADAEALRAEARRLGIKASVIKERQGEVFIREFRAFKQAYEQRERRPFPSTEKGKKAMQDTFLKARGMGFEVEGLLNALVPDQILSPPEVNAFYQSNSEAMNGLLQVSQIFIKNRDQRTGALLRGKALKDAQAKAKEVGKLLAKDGSNFETIAAGYSENSRSAKQKGIMKNVHRFDPRMPAALCRAVWNLRNNQWTGPIQTRYGLHFVKRIEWTITKMIVNPDPKNQMIRGFIRSSRQETLLFDLRKKANIELFY